MEDLKNQIEAILFSVGKKINIEKIAVLCKSTNINLIEENLRKIRVDYDEKESPMRLIHEGDDWKLTIRENYLHIVRNIVTDTELSKSITETLAIIAFKYPISQADLIKIRSNKAYEHVKELKQMNFIEKIKNGRTFDIKLTSKFFEYFDLPEDKVKKTFKNYESVEKVIEEKEDQYQKEKEDIESQNEKLKAQLKEMQMSEDDYMKELDEMTPKHLQSEDIENIQKSGEEQNFQERKDQTIQELEEETTKEEIKIINSEEKQGELEKENV